MSTAAPAIDRQLEDEVTPEELAAEKAAGLSGGEEDEASKLAAEELAKKAAEQAEAEAAAKAKADQDAADALAAKTKADEEAAAAAAAEAAKKKPDDKYDDNTLRALAREQKRELDRTQVELERMRRQLEKAGLVDEEDKKEMAAEQAKAKEAYDAKMVSLNLLLETMKVNPKFEDVESVVSQDNFDDLVEAMAKLYVQENGGSLREATKAMEGHIWSQPNPYLYAYERIKAYHPAYRKPPVDAAKAAQEKADAEAKAKAEAEAKAKEAAKAPGSVAGMAGAGSGPGGWTAAMIDGLEEEDLPSVPKETYEKYLRGELK